MKRTFMALLLAGTLLIGLLSGCGTDVPETVEVNGDLTVVFLKVGAADAAVLMTENVTVILDTGESNDGGKVVDLLKAYGRDSADLMLISHYDKDHVGGAAEILENIAVSRVIGSTSPKDSDEVAAYRAALASAGIAEESPKAETIVLDGMVITVDPPPKKSYEEDQSNNSSVIVTVAYGETKLLFTGDAMTARLAEFSWQDGQYDLIKIPHHGRDPADLAAYLGAFKDGGSAIVTSSKKEPESDELTASLEESGIAVYLTRNGNATAVSDGKTVTVTQ